MGLFRKMFGPSREEVWRELCRVIDAEYVDGGFWKGGKVLARAGEWTITLDTYTQSSGKSSTTYTRMRAPYVNRDGFRFTVYRKSIFSGIGKFFGMQDVEVGWPGFDEDFIIKGNDEVKLMQLFANKRIRDLIERQRNIHLTVKADEGWFGAQFPDGVDELYFRTIGIIREVGRLKDLYDLFSETLQQLCVIGSAYEDDPNVAL